tara:strand:- start:7219 stop:7413 length:195 start_codon:yes stop_codon:yes gene_type:complete
MTARVVPKHEVARLLDLLIARGLPPSSLVAIPGGKVMFNLAAGTDDETDSEGRANPWDVVLADS